MIFGIAVITASWLLNAAMDAIDHGKGGMTLKALWHVLKWLSYALPFGYIFLLTQTPIYVIVGTAIILWAAWEALYRYLRSIDFWRWDK